MVTCAGGVTTYVLTNTEIANGEFGVQGDIPLQHFKNLLRACKDLPMDIEDIEVMPDQLEITSLVSRFVSTSSPAEIEQLSIEVEKKRASLCQLREAIVGATRGLSAELTARSRDMRVKVSAQKSIQHSQQLGDRAAALKSKIADRTVTPLMLEWEKNGHPAISTYVGDEDYDAEYDFSRPAIIEKSAAITNGLKPIDEAW